METKSSINKALPLYRSQFMSTVSLKLIDFPMGPSTVASLLLWWILASKLTVAKVPGLVSEVRGSSQIGCKGTWNRIQLQVLTSTITQPHTNSEQKAQPLDFHTNTTRKWWFQERNWQIFHHHKGRAHRK